MSSLPYKTKRKDQRFVDRENAKSTDLIHLMRRFSQRLGFLPYKLDIEEILEQINNKTAEVIKTDRQCTIYKVLCKNKYINAVYHRENKKLKTVYPFDREKKERQHGKYFC